MVKELLSQYRASLAMLDSVIAQYDEDLWVDNETYAQPAYEWAHHAIFFANFYCAAKEADVVHLPGDLDPKKQRITKDQMLELSAHVMVQIPKYLESYDAEANCWPHWYQLNQFEFHLNNLRHIQHHTAQLIERHRQTKRLDVNWSTFRPM